MDGKRGQVVANILTYPSFYQLVILYQLPTWDLEPELIVPSIHRLLIQGDTTKQSWVADSDGNGHALDLSHAIRRVAAESILALAPNSSEPGAAHDYLVLRKPNPAEALRAIVALRKRDTHLEPFPISSRSSKTPVRLGSLLR